MICLTPYSLEMLILFRFRSFSTPTARSPLSLLRQVKSALGSYMLVIQLQSSIMRRISGSHFTSPPTQPKVTKVPSQQTVRQTSLESRLLQHVEDDRLSSNCKYYYGFAPMTSLGSRCCLTYGEKYSLFETFIQLRCSVNAMIQTSSA